MNHSFLAVIGNVAPESMIHLLAKSEIASYAMKR